MSAFVRLHSTTHAVRIGAPLGGLAAMFLAACGGVAYGGTTSSASSGAGSGGAVVGVDTTKVGTFLVDKGGRTLYLFEKDSNATSNCTGACLGVWPALTTGSGVQAGNGVNASLLATITRPDGSTQVTYNGHPLYYYVGDGRTGDTNGEGLNQFGAGWYVVSPRGSKIDTD